MKECPTCHRCFADHINHCGTDGAMLVVTIPGESVLDGRYELKRRLGQGGMGAVYEARHSFLKTVHAIKVILPEFLVGNDPEFVRRFRQEAMAAANIRHPNVIRVTDYGLSGGTTPFLVMDFIRGKILQDLLAEEQRLTPERALELMEPIMSGVGAAHKLGIVHRDLKPLNIIIEEGLPLREAIKVLDFGLAKIKTGELLGSFVAAKSSGVMGSPPYMAPEQWSEEEFDARTDIYSLGIILYQMLTGTVPFKGASAPTIMKKHLMDEPPRCVETGVNVPPRVEAVVRHALEKNPDHRPQTVADFLEELRAAVYEPVTAPQRPNPATIPAQLDTLIPDAEELRKMRQQPFEARTIPHDSSREHKVRGAGAAALHAEEEERRQRSEQERIAEEAARRAEEEATRKRAEEEAARRRAEEEAAARAAEEERRREAEALRLREEQERAAEAARRAEEERLRKEREEEARRLKEEEERRAAAEAERLRREAAAREAEERRRREEEEERLRQEEEEERRAAAARAAVLERLRLEEELRRRLEEEEAAERAAVQERLRLEREAEERRAAEARALEAARLAEQERQRKEAERRAAEEAERRQKEEEARKLAAAEAARRAAELEQQRAAEEARRLAEAEAERQRKAEAERQRKEEAERKRKEDAERKRAAELARQREDAARKAQEEEKRRAEAKAAEEKRLREEEEKRRNEEEARRRKQDEERRRKEEEERRRAAQNNVAPAQPTVQPAPFTPPAVHPAAQQGQAAKRSPAPLIALAAVVALVFGGGGLYLLSGSRGEGRDNNTGGGTTNTTVNTNTNAPAVNANTVGGVTTRGPELIEIAGGTFRMGRDGVPPDDEPAKNAQYPSHQVSVKRFMIDKTEVTNAEYADFVRETGYDPPSHWQGGAPRAGEESLPVVNVSFNDAQKFAAWRSKRDNVKYRLPKEEEWEFAARNGGSSLYPWGGDWADDRVNLGGGGLRPVGSYPQGASSAGVLDLIGNAWEWTSSEGKYYPGSEYAPKDVGWIVIRGGSYLSMDESSVQDRGSRPFPATWRQWQDKKTKSGALGFRLVRELP